ncbi:unnamed protein product [Cuscuta campestris]|uniref:Uncharacterized protein n=1 Tax=Cuscuta campestris TaxID=132261 RepID=A0A484N8F6_9ASTE|nr:unnamed protein product [Cuscuta campestris]VFQ97345.1 unnamed protein product [Cuscuta campestris]
MVRIKHALPKWWKGKSSLKKELWAKHRWTRLLATKDSQQSDVHLETKEVEEDRENLTQSNLLESNMEQPGSQYAEAKARDVTEDDGLVVAEEEEPAPPLLQVDLRHFEGKHYNDMPRLEDQKAAPAVLQSDISKTAFIKAEIKLLQEQIEG